MLGAHAHAAPATKLEQINQALSTAALSGLSPADGHSGVRMTSPMSHLAMGAHQPSQLNPHVPVGYVRAQHNPQRAGPGSGFESVSESSSPGNSGRAGNGSEYSGFGLPSENSPEAFHSSAMTGSPAGRLPALPFPYVIGGPHPGGAMTAGVGPASGGVDPSMFPLSSAFAYAGLGPFTRMPLPTAHMPHRGSGSFEGQFLSNLHGGGYPSAYAADAAAASVSQLNALRAMFAHADVAVASGAADIQSSSRPHATASGSGSGNGTSHSSGNGTGSGSGATGQAGQGVVAWPNAAAAGPVNRMTDEESTPASAPSASNAGQNGAGDSAMSESTGRTGPTMDEEWVSGSASRVADTASRAASEGRKTDAAEGVKLVRGIDLGLERRQQQQQQQQRAWEEHRARQFDAVVNSPMFLDVAHAISHLPPQPQLIAMQQLSSALEVDVARAAQAVLGAILPGGANARGQAAAAGATAAGTTAGDLGNPATGGRLSIMSTDSVATGATGATGTGASSSPQSGAAGEGNSDVTPTSPSRPQPDTLELLGGIFTGIQQLQLSARSRVSPSGATRGIPRIGTGSGPQTGSSPPQEPRPSLSVGRGYFNSGSGTTPPAEVESNFSRCTLIVWREIP